MCICIYIYIYIYIHMYTYIFVQFPFLFHYFKTLGSNGRPQKALCEPGRFRDGHFSVSSNISLFFTFMQT